MSKEDIMNKIEQRDAKRKQGVVKAIVSDELTQEQPEQSQEQQAGDGVIIAPKVKQETRSKRVNLLAKPSTVKEAEKKCKRLGISLNEAMNQFLENWIQQK